MFYFTFCLSFGDNQKKGKDISNPACEIEVVLKELQCSSDQKESHKRETNSLTNATNVVEVS
jgi:hypothetical protein